MVGLSRIRLLARLHTLSGDALIRGGVALLVLLTPVFVDINLQRIFVLPKIALLRLIVLLIIGAWTVRAFSQPTVNHKDWLRQISHLPLIKPIAAVFLVVSLGALLSIQPLQSFFGSYLRMQGWLTVISYLVVGLTIALLFQHQEWIERLIDLALLGCWPVVVYGLIQASGGEGIAWLNYTGRILSTLGNPIFLGAYLVLLLPLTVYRLYTLWTAYRQRQQTDALVGMIGCGGLLLAQLATTFLSQSRGPVLALIVQTVFLLLVLAGRRARLVLHVGLVVGLVALALVAGFGVASSLIPQASPWVGRLTNLSDDNYRGLIWSHVVALVGSDPIRLVIGYGPETLYPALLPVYSPALAFFGGQAQQIDRAHNLILDTLAGGGMLELVVRGWLFLSTLLLGLRLSEIISSRRQSIILTLTTLISALLGALLAYGLTGGWVWSAMGAGLGLVVGLYVSLAVLHRPAAGQSNSEKGLQPPGVLALLITVGLVGYFVGAQFSPDAEVTILLYWVYTGLLIALAMAERSKTSNRLGRFSARPIMTPDFSNDFLIQKDTLVLISLLTSVTFLGLLDWLQIYLDGTLNNVKLLPPLVTALMTWILSMSLFFWQRVIYPQRDPAPNLGLTVLLSSSFISSAIIVYAFLVVFSVVLLPVLYVYLLALVTLLMLAWDPERSQAQISRASAYLMPRLGVGLVTVGAIILVSFSPFIADRYYTIGHRLLLHGRSMNADFYFSRAITWAPNEDFYYLAFSNALADNAVKITDPDRQSKDFEHARGLALRAVSLHPEKPYNLANLAGIELRAAEASIRAQARVSAVERGLSLYPHAANQLWYNPEIFEIWGSLLMLKGQSAEAIAKYHVALRLNPMRVQPLILLGKAYQAEGNLTTAEEYYRRAIEADARRIEPLVALSEMKVVQSQYEEALRYARAAVRLAPEDIVLRQNLALIYSKLGQPAAAAEEIRVALRYATPADELRLRELLKQLGAN